MKKILLGSTALATAAFLSAGAANAADEGLKMSVTGWFTGVLMAGADDNANTREVSLDTWDSEIHFNAEGTASNGLTYGFRVELEGSTANDQIDESYLYLKGAFGKIIVGADDSVASAMSYASPAPDTYGILSVNSPNYFLSSGATVTTFNAIGFDATKIIYITPAVGGFQLGLSYSPDSCEDRGCVNGGFEADNDLGVANGQQFAAALTFSKEFSGVSVGLSGTYTWNETETAGLEDVTTYGFGANVGFGLGAGTVTVGGSYLTYQDYLGVSGIDYTAYDAGVQYAQGPFTVGVQSIWGDFDLGSEDQVWGLSVGGGYEIATGLGLSVGYIHYDKDANVGNNADVFLLGTKVAF